MIFKYIIISNLLNSSCHSNQSNQINFDSNFNTERSSYYFFITLNRSPWFLHLCKFSKIIAGRNEIVLIFSYFIVCYLSKFQPSFLSIYSPSPRAPRNFLGTTYPGSSTFSFSLPFASSFLNRPCNLPTTQFFITVKIKCALFATTNSLVLINLAAVLSAFIFLAKSRDVFTKVSNSFLKSTLYPRKASIRREQSDFEQIHSTFFDGASAIRSSSREHFPSQLR